MIYEGVRKEENILKLEYIKGVVWRALDDGLRVMIGGDMNVHIWELDGCENKNGRRTKENMNEFGIQILNCVWDGLNEATWYTEEKNTEICVYGWKRHEESCECQYTFGCEMEKEENWQEDRRWMTDDVRASINGR